MDEMRKIKLCVIKWDFENSFDPCKRGNANVKTKYFTGLILGGFLFKNLWMLAVYQEIWFVSFHHFAQGSSRVV